MPLRDRAHGRLRTLGVSDQDEAPPTGVTAPTVELPTAPQAMMTPAAARALLHIVVTAAGSLASVVAGWDYSPDAA
jgi:hypothetical protein